MLENLTWKLPCEAYSIQKISGFIFKKAATTFKLILSLKEKTEGVKMQLGGGGCVCVCGVCALYAPQRDQGRDVVGGGEGGTGKIV